MKKNNLLSILCLSAASVFLFYSCSKSSGTPTPKKSTSTTTITNAQVAGYWFGSFDNKEYNQSVLLKSDGTLKVYDFYFNPTSTDTTQAYDGVGTFSIKGDTLITNTSFPNGQTFTGSINILNIKASPESYSVLGSDDVYVKQ